jgi:multiple antibiotic resistance protein
VAVAAILLPIGHLLIAKHMKLFENAIKIATRLGGILILTIGVQLMLGGIKTFFGV